MIVHWQLYSTCIDMHCAQNRDMYISLRSVGPRGDILHCPEISGKDELERKDEGGVKGIGRRMKDKKEESG